MARTPKKRLRTLVSKLKAGAIAAAKRVTRRATPAKRPSYAAPSRGSAKSTTAVSPKARRSVVRKPARVVPSPSPAAAKISTRAKTSKPAPAPAPILRRSVVRKPARGPSLRTAARSKAPVAIVAKPRRATKGRNASPSAPRSPAAPFVFGEQASGASAPDSGAIRSVEEQFTLPAGYGDHRIVLMVRDPFWLFAYWEIQPEQERAVRGQLKPEEIAGLQTVLRVYDVTGTEYPAQPAVRHFDIELSGLARSWHIHTDAPGRTFLVEIGLLTASGRFLMLARSNRVTTPRCGPSEIIDEAWLVTDEDYGKLFGASGIGPGSSPGAWSRLLNQQLSSASLSHGFVGQLKAGQLKGFWCRVDADLVLHGATEPRARVIVQEQPVTVRKDGTFSVRLALPQGKQAITVDVTSPNGRHTRTVTPIISLTWTGQPDKSQPIHIPQSASERVG